MAGPNAPNNETVRVDLAPPIAAKSRDLNIKSRETVRMQLPLRESLGKGPLNTPTGPQPPAESAAHALVPSQFSQPVRPPSFSPLLSATVRPAPDSFASGLKKETLRVPPVADPLASAGQVKNTPPRIPMPHVVSQNCLTEAASPEKSSLLLCWILLAVSALILIIQIWTYLF